MMMKKIAKDVATEVGEQIINLPDSDTPNYKVGAAASALFGLVYLSSLGSCSLSNYLSLAGFIFLSGLTIKQYGPEKLYRDASKKMMTLFKPEPPANGRELENVAFTHKGLLKKSM